MITNCVKKPPVNHHYVPQSYLRYFSNKHKKEWQIIVADKTKEDAFITNIENVASERNFNKVERRSDPYYWESYYATEVDDLIKPTFDTIIAICNLAQSNAKILVSGLKDKLCFIICSQLLRTKKARNYMNSISKDVSEKVLDNIIKVYGNLFTKEQLEKIESYKRDDEIIKELQLEIINNKDRIDRLSLLLKDRIWIVYKNINYKICPFVTSDHPIVYFNYKNRKTDFNSNGLGITETIIYFPLNREILLALFPKNMYYTPLDDLNDRFQLLNDNAFVMKLNKAQYEQCHRQTYFTFYK